MKNKRPSGYFWRFRRMLINNGILKGIWTKDYSFPNNSKLIWTVDMDKIVNLSDRQIKYFVRNTLNFRKLFFFIFFLIIYFFVFFFFFVFYYLF